MVPAAIMVLPSWPLTPNGKLDRQGADRLRSRRRAPARLARPAHARGKDPLCALCRDAVVQRVGIEDNFFELGGHSLLATRLVSRVRATLRVELAIRGSVRGPTVAELAERLNKAQEAKAPLRAMVRPEEIPLSFAQRRLWFLDRLEGPSPTYNIAVAVRLSGALDAGALEAALGDLVERHESLRTIFAETQGVPPQLIPGGARGRTQRGVRSLGEANLSPLSPRAAKHLAPRSRCVLSSLY